MKNSIIRRASIVVMLASALMLNACATESKSVGFGGAIGAGTGMLIGGIADPGVHGKYRTRNIIIGGTLGALTGMAAGGLIHSSMEKERRDGFNAGQAAESSKDANAANPPQLIPAQWRAEVVEARRVGNRFIPRHVEYVITEPARWSSGD